MQRINFRRKQRSHFNFEKNDVEHYYRVKKNISESIEETSERNPFLAEQSKFFAPLQVCIYCAVFCLALQFPPLSYPSKSSFLC
jgi:hypothetical protein